MRSGPVKDFLNPNFLYLIRLNKNNSQIIILPSKGSNLIIMHPNNNVPTSCNVLIVYNIGNRGFAYFFRFFQTRLISVV